MFIERLHEPGAALADGNAAVNGTKALSLLRWGSQEADGLGMQGRETSGWRTGDHGVVRGVPLQEAPGVLGTASHGPGHQDIAALLFCPHPKPHSLLTSPVTSLGPPLT